MGWVSLKLCGCFYSLLCERFLYACDDIHQLMEYELILTSQEWYSGLWL
jgi:hypothetical protein